MDHFEHMGLGDTVRLNCGGPLMTITKIKDADYTCAWIAPDGTPHCAIYPEIALEHVVEGDKAELRRLRRESARRLRKDMPVLQGAAN